MRADRRWLLLAVVFSILPTLLVSAGERLHIPLGLDAYMPIPEDNPLTARKAALGRELFADPRLSRDEKVSCATCHEPQRAFTDAREVAIGVFGRRGSRRVPRLVNRGYGRSFFWDGRSATLEEQVVRPIQDPKEMDLTLAEAAARVASVRRYQDLFREAFAREITTQDLARALASYVRTILSGDSPYDRYINGDSSALSEEARRGLRVFRGKGNCTACHLGPNLTDESFHNTGLAWRDGRFADDGRLYVTRNEKDQGAFKTPTLREAARSAPYMHDGSMATLEEVVAYYDRGGNKNPYLDPELRPLNLTEQEKKALIAFLQSLNGTLRDGM
ncbi:MAG: cytochrome-c peroxidase [Gammaproteobacteria bacterium]